MNHTTLRALFSGTFESGPTKLLPARPSGTNGARDADPGLENAPDLEPDPADPEWKDAKALVQHCHTMFNCRFGLRGGAQKRDRTTLSPGSIDLPSDSPARCRAVDHPSRVLTHEPNTESSLSLGVGDHRLTEGMEIPVKDCPTGGYGRISQPREHL